MGFGFLSSFLLSLKRLLSTPRRPWLPYLNPPPSAPSPLPAPTDGVINGSYHSGLMLARARAAVLKGGLWWKDGRKGVGKLLCVVPII